ncbi:MAG: sulfatase/phosphatase domain-containing protein, partial [Anaerolineae bacterium]
YKGIWPWESLMRVPFVWRAPDGVASPEGSQQVVSLLDFAPTVLDYAGVDPEVLNMRKPADSDAGPKSEWPGLPGRSLRSLIDAGIALPQRPAICEYDEDWKSPRMVRRRTIVTKRWKLSVFPKLGDGLLIDLREDPHETRNLWGDADYAGVQSRLTAQLLEELVWSDRLAGPRICGA